LDLDPNYNSETCLHSLRKQTFCGLEANSPFDPIRTSHVHVFAGLTKSGRYGTPRQLIKLLSPHKYQLSHDCFIEYGLGKEHQGQITEVFVTTEKWFQVWFNDEVPFLSVMKTHEIPKARKLHFIDEFPKIRTTLSAEKVQPMPAAKMVAAPGPLGMLSAA
jgi:hypothetical protein